MKPSIRFAAIILTSVWLLPGCNRPVARAGQVVEEPPTDQPATNPTAHPASDWTDRPTSEGADRPASPLTDRASSGQSGASGTDQRRLRAEDLKGLAWRSVGPANMGGRVADIGVAPGNPKTFYLAYGTGGLFKTTNNGTTFTPVFDKEATASIGSVVVADAPLDWPGWNNEDQKKDADDQADPDKKGKAKIVWVGTGEGNGRNSSSWGNGVYRSTDEGATFKNVGLKDTHDIPRIAVDPRNPDICYVAAMGHLWGPNKTRGLYKTTDGGKNWKAILQVDEQTGCCDVVLDPGDPDIVYAAMYTRQRKAYKFRSGGPDGGIFRSDDAGRTFKKLTNGLPAETGRIGLDVYRKDSRIVYALVESDVGGRSIDAWHSRSKAGGVFRSEDRGDTWKRMSDLTPRPFYFSRVRIDPKDDQRIYLPGWGLGVSDDGGKHFRAGLAHIAHVDMHAMYIDPEDTDHLIIGNDGGAYVSYDRGKAWDFLNHMAVGEFYNIAVDESDPYRIGGGLQDNGSWIGPGENRRQTTEDALGDTDYAITNADWRFISGGDGFHVAFDPVDPNILYAESQGGELVRIHLDTGRRKRLKPAAKEGQPRFRFNWNAPFFISPHDPSVLYLGGNHVFKLTERGDHWQRISEDLSTGALDKMITVGSDAETYGTVVSLAESPLARGMIWAGTDDGLIHRTTDDGATWTNVTPPAVDGRYISKIEASRHERDTAYAAVDGHRSDDMTPHLLMTTDAGASWQSIAGDLPTDAPVKVVREDRRNADVLYAGTERAAYVTIDRGAHWVKLNGDTLPTVAVDDLVQHPREMDLIAGTHGRSVYVLDDASPLAQLTEEVLNTPLHVFDIPDAKPRIYLPYGGLWSDRMFRAKNPPMGARISYWLQTYSAETVKVTITDEHDNTIRSLTGSNHPGINRVVWDLQYEKKDRFGNPESRMGQTIFVPPGTYTVTITQGQDEAKHTFIVLRSPIDNE